MPGVEVWNENYRLWAFERMCVCVRVDGGGGGGVCEWCHVVPFKSHLPSPRRRHLATR